MDNAKRTLPSRSVERRTVLAMGSGVATVALAGCLGVLGDDDPDIREDQTEPPNTEFGWSQSTGLAHSVEITLTLRHQGGDPVDTSTLTLLYNDELDEESDEPIHLRESDAWEWAETGGVPQDFDEIGEVMGEEARVRARSTPGHIGRGADPDDEFLRGTFELVWTSPETGEDHVIDTYELQSCVGNEPESVDECH